MCLNTITRLAIHLPHLDGAACLAPLDTFHSNDRLFASSETVPLQRLASHALRPCALTCSLTLYAQPYICSEALHPLPCRLCACTTWAVAGPASSPSAPTVMSPCLRNLRAWRRQCRCGLQGMKVFANVYDYVINRCQPCTGQVAMTQLTVTYSDCCLPTC